jgi:energy-coupling factor transporter ATP-binding protein EcfA2
MYQLERIVLNNWGRLDPQDIDVRGSTAILGPTGAGKSTIVDALQVIVTGASSRYYDLNKSSTGGHNERTIRDYCLGADDQITPDAPARKAADTLIALAFRDRLSGEALSIGLLFSATADEPMGPPRSRFVAPGYAIKLADFIEPRDGGINVVPINARILERLKQLCPKLKQHMSAIAYVDDYLHAMRSRGAAPDSHQVLRNFKQSVAFQPIDNPTEFIRKHILEESNIDVEALRGSIERYRFLEQEVVKREQQLVEIAEARRRLQLWAQHTIRHNVLRFIMAHAELRRVEIVIKRLEARRLDIAREVEQEGAVKRRHEQSISQLQEDHLRQRALLTEAPEAMQVRALEADRARYDEKRLTARGAIGRRTGQLVRFAELAQRADRVPMEFADSLKAVGELIQLIRGKTPESLAAVDIDLVVLEKRILPLVGAERSLSQQLEAVAGDVHRQKTRLDALESSLTSSGDGPLLSPRVREFMALLESEGISATPLPDLVDVSDPTWAMALEMLLGPHREALIVPQDRTVDAYSLLYRERRNLDSCRLIDTRKTARWQSRLDERSIATIVVTDSHDARAFIERQVGRFLKAETDHDLERLDQAVTKRGKTTQGMALRVFRDIDPIFGKTAQQAATQRAREEFAELSAQLRTTLADRDGLQTALNVIAAIREEPVDVLAEALAALVEADASLRAIAQARATLDSPEARKIRDEIAGIEADIQLYRTEISEEIEPKLKALSEADIKLQVELHGNVNAQRKLEEDEEIAIVAATRPPVSTLLELLASSDTIDAARQRVAVAAELVPEDRDPAAQLADLVAEAKTEAEPLPRLAEDGLKRGRNGYVQFFSTHIGAPPLSDPDDAAIFRWCRFREKQLEDDELRRYKDEFAEARIKMETDLTEGLINRLSDKFQTARAQIDRLNRSLAGRHFTGQSYMFRHSLNAAMKPIHALAEAIADAPQRGLAMLQDDDVDPRVRNGFKELERRLSDDQLVIELQDYRRFFDFELHMTNDRGQETTLSKRSATGSGGQKQAPYYVAVGAAMAAAYYPKSVVGEPDGVGLVVFDEAFNNLDAPNTRALLEFFSDLHLQVIVAADKVRAMFLETVETIVSVNRRPDTQEPVVTVTHPSQLAREALSNINPVNLGVEAFRPVSAAAE